jgi:signal transduction histidine kinase
VLSIAGDEDGGLWFGTLDGLTYRNGTNSISFNSKNGLKESVVHQILSASGGYLWVSGLHGVHRLELEGMKRRSTNGPAPMRCVTVGRADGMLSSETSGGQQPAGLVSKDGMIWVPTGQGVAMIDPNLVRENTNCPVAVIEAVYGPRGAKLLEDQHPPVVHTNTGVPRVWLSSKISPASRSMLEIQYTANTFVQPAEAQFEYRLLPLELNWRDPTTRRVAVYTRLTPGKYTFQLRSANSHGYSDAGVQELDFYVKPMPHEEWWFWITVGALSSVGVGGLIRSRWRRQRENIRAEVTSLERERTRIARDLHDDVGANMTGLALKAQLAALEFPGEPSSKLQEIARDIRSLVDRMREVIWAVNPDCDTLENLVNYLTHYVEGFLTAAGCRCRLDVPAALPRLPVCAEARHNLLSVTKEALNNSVKHAEASEVLVRIAVDPTRLQLQIKDNGVGFNPDDTEIIRINGSGHGMGNMRKRIEDLRGKFTVRSSHGEGTDIVAELQLTDLAKVKNKSNGHNDTAASQRRSNQPQKYDRHSSPAQHR